MATTRFWKITSNLDYVIDYVGNTEKTIEKTEADGKDDLKNVLHYAANPEKTEAEEKLYVTGVNCNHMTAYEEMNITKKQWQKEDGVLAWHGYMSFAPGEVTPELAHAIGVEFAEKNFPGFQVVVGTHLNTGIIHNHFVVNSVSYLDGHRAHDEVTWFKFHKLADEIVKSHKLSVIKKPRRTKELTLIDNKIQDYYRRTDAPLIKEAVDKALAVSTNMVTFKRELAGLGYNYNLSPNRKYWTVSPKGGRSFRLYHLGEEYTNAGIMERLAANQKKIRNPVTQKITVRRYVFRWYTGNKTTIEKLYWHYMYILGKVQSNREETSYLPHNIRKDVAQLNAISEEAKFLEKNGISLSSELLNHMDELKSQMAGLEESRNVLRNEMRRKGADTEAIKKNISEAGKELAEKRKELRMCENILKRSETMSDNIAVMEQQEERRDKNEYRSRDSESACRNNN